MKKFLTIMNIVVAAVIGSIFAIFFLLAATANASGCTIVVSSATTPDETDWGFNTQQKLAVPFVATCTGNVTNVTIRARYSASPSASNVGIYSDSAGEPGSIVGGQAPDVVIGSPAAYIFNPVTAPVVNGTTYWAVIDSSIGYSSSDFFLGQGDGTGAGGMKSWNGSAWTNWGNGHQNMTIDIVSTVDPQHVAHLLGGGTIRIVGGGTIHLQ